MILSVANQKGGVAKTTSTLAIASNLKKKGYKALVIDMDPQGNLSESVNANQIEVPTIYELLKQEVTANETIQKLDFFDIIPSNIMLAGGEQELSFTGKEYRLKESLENINALYDYIIIDTPPSLGILTINAFTASDEVLIPTTPGIFAVNGIEQLNNTINNVKKYCNKDLKINGILITRFNPRVNINKSIKTLTEQLANHIGSKVYNTYIRNSVIIEESQANKINLFDNYKSATVTEDYNSFVKEFLNNNF